MVYDSTARLYKGRTMLGETVVTVDGEGVRTSSGHPLLHWIHGFRVCLKKFDPFQSAHNFPASEVGWCVNAIGGEMLDAE